MGAFLKLRRILKLGRGQEGSAAVQVVVSRSSATTAYNNLKALTKTLGPASISLSGIKTATYTGGATQNVMVIAGCIPGHSQAALKLRQAEPIYGYFCLSADSQITCVFDSS